MYSQAIQQQQVAKTGTLASFMQEPYSSPGHVSRSRKTGLKFSPRNRPRPASASAANVRPRLNTKTLSRRVALSHQPSSASTSSPRQNASFSQTSSASSPLTKVSTQHSSASSPRVRGKSLPPRLLNLANGSRSGSTGSNIFLHHLPPFTYPLVPAALPGVCSSLPSLQRSSAAQSVNLFKHGTLSSQYHTVAIPLDVFTQQLAFRPPVSVPFAPVHPVFSRMEVPNSPPVCMCISDLAHS